MRSRRVSRYMYGTASDAGH